MFDFFVICAKIIDSELFVSLDCLVSFLVFVSIALEEKEKLLICPEFLIEIDVVGFQVFVEFLKFGFLVLVMFYLPEIKETSSVFCKLSFLLFFYHLRWNIPEGKNR